MQTYLYVLHPAAAEGQGRGSVSGPLRDEPEGSFFSASLQKLLMGPTFLEAARGSSTGGGKTLMQLFHADSAPTEAALDQEGCQPNQLAPGLSPAPHGVADWQLATVDPLFLNLFNTCRSVAAAHLAPADAARQEARAAAAAAVRAERGSPHGSSMTSTGKPCTPAPSIMTGGGYTGTGTAATSARGSYRSMRSAMCTTGSHSTASRHSHSCTPLQHSPSSVFSGALWNALLGGNAQAPTRTSFDAASGQGLKSAGTQDSWL